MKTFVMTKMSVALLSAFTLMHTAQALAAGATPDVNIPRAAPAPLPTVKPADVKTEAKPAFQASDEKGLKVTVEQFTFTGNASITSEQLSALLADFQNKSIGLNELNQAAAAVTDYYRQQGFFLAQAYLPEQDIAGKTVEIAVLEGQLGAVSISADDGLDQSFLTDMAGYNLLAGTSVTDKNLIRNTSVLNSLPGIEASVQLSPGDAVGSTDVNVEFQALPTLQGWGTFDTYGNRFTGREVMSGGVKWNNPLGLGDQFVLSLKNASNGGQKGAQFAYYTPIYASGTLLNVGYSYTEYKLGSIFRPLDAKGDSEYINIGLSQPFLRDAVKGFSATVNLTRQKVSDEIGIFALDNKRNVDSVDFGLVGDWTSFAQDAVYQLGINARFGEVDFKNAVAEALDATGSKTKGSYRKLNINATRIQYFSNGLSLNLYADYQVANENLDSVEKFSIGGINRWRNFAELPSLADTGLMAGAELRKNITAGKSLQSLLMVGLTPYVFADFGRGKINQDPTSSSDNHVQSIHAGMGIDFAFKQDWFLSVAGSHQNRDFDGADAENETRFWGKLQKNF